MPTLLPEGKAKHGFIEMARFHVALRCRKELFMLHKDYMSTGENLHFPCFVQTRYACPIRKGGVQKQCR